MSSRTLRECAVLMFLVAAIVDRHALAETKQTEVFAYPFPSTDEGFNRHVLMAIGAGVQLEDIEETLYTEVRDGSALIVWVVFPYGQRPQARLFAVEIAQNGKLSTSEINLPSEFQQLALHSVFLDDAFDVIGGANGSELWFKTGDQIPIPPNGEWGIDVQSGYFFVTDPQKNTLLLAKTNAPTRGMLQLSTVDREFNCLHSSESRLYLIGSVTVNPRTAKTVGVCLGLKQAENGTLEKSEEILIPRPEKGKGGYFRPVGMDPSGRGIIFVNRTESSLTLGDLPMRGSGTYYFDLLNRKLTKLRGWSNGTVFVQKDLYERFVPSKYRKKAVTIPH